MNEKKINLAEILKNVGNITDFDTPEYPQIIASMNELCNQLVAACLENAKIVFPDNFDKYVAKGTKIPTIDKTSILRTKEQIV